jgi:hypothetical protein
MGGKHYPTRYAFDMVKEHPITLKVIFGHSPNIIHPRTLTPSGHFENMAYFLCVLSWKHTIMDKVIDRTTIYFQYIKDGPFLDFLYDIFLCSNWQQL